ncbi:MAG TPA: MFS transporter [Rhodopila sp.]|uniref:MFS transporter n=1 Tax=Rhodopila sp. TaxID=2480087 RepID=UPI002C425F7A|nr:MFS transporter [Rhodopila sp.]HVY14011.1 MFS transporter [Rhodopila sp.]
MPITHRRYWVYAMLFSLGVINFIDRITMSVAAKPIANELGLSPIELGYLFSSFYWMYVICLIPGGVLADRLGGRKIAALAIGVWSVMQMLTGLVGSYATMLAVRIGLGIGEAPTNGAVSRTLRDWAPFSERGLSMSIFTGGSYAGPAFGAALSGMLVAAVGWRLSFVITGGIGFLWLAIWLIWFRKPEHVSWLPDAERNKIVAEREVSGHPEGADIGFLGLLKQPSMWGVALTQGCMTYNQYLFLAWLPNYLETSQHMTVLDTGYLVTLAYTISVIASISLSLVADRVLTAEKVRDGRRRGAVCASMLVAAVVILIPWSGSLAFTLTLITVSLTFSATALALNFTLCNDLVTLPGSVGKAFGILTVGGNIFGLLAPIVTGYVVQFSGRFDTTYIISGVLLLIGSVVVMTLTRHPIGEAEPTSLSTPARRMA